MNSKSQQVTQGSRTNAFLGQQLRAVGQGLESLDVVDFELRAEGDGYFALGMPRTPVKAADATIGSPQINLRNTLQNAWHSLISRGSADSKTENATSHVLRILFTPEGIVKLEREGIAKRSENSAGVPNLEKLAQVLRVVGEYLETKSGRLLKVSKRQDRVLFEYATASSNLVKEDWNLSALYEFWLQMSTQREARRNILDRTLTNDPEKPGIESHR
jgi:hypothetical protein